MKRLWAFWVMQVCLHFQRVPVLCIATHSFAELLHPFPVVRNWLFGRHEMLGLVRLSRGLGVLGKRRIEVGSSIPIDHLPHGRRDGRLGEACEVRVEMGACAHARVGLAVAPAIVDDAPMLRLARSACRMQVSVSSMRPTRGRSAGRPVRITCLSSS